MGLGKDRTKLGKWMDRMGVKQGELPVNKNTATRLCSDLKYEPYEETILTVISYLRKKGYSVSIQDFW